MNLRQQIYHVIHELEKAIEGRSMNTFFYEDDFHDQSIMDKAKQAYAIIYNQVGMNPLPENVSFAYERFMTAFKDAIVDARENGVDSIALFLQSFDLKELFDYDEDSLYSERDLVYPTSNEAPVKVAESVVEPLKINVKEELLESVEKTKMSKLKKTALATTGAIALYHLLF